MTVQLESISDI